MTASSGSTNIATVSVSGTTITVTAKATGSATITVNVGADTNYTAPSSKTFTVAVTLVSKTLSSNSWAVIKAVSDAGQGANYMDDYCIILPDIEDLKKLGRAIVRQFEIRGIPVNKKKCKIIPLTKPFRWCKARFTLTETGKIKVNGSRDGVIRARRKLKLFHREWLAGKRTLQEVAQYMNCQEAYYKNFDDHGRLLRLRRLCYAIFGGRVPCSTKSSKPVMAPSLP